MIFDTMQWNCNGVFSGISASTSGNNPLLFSSALASRLGLALPNPAPEVEMTPAPLPQSVMPGQGGPLAAAAAELSHEPKKKKYAKEAWPGKKLMPTLLVWAAGMGEEFGVIYRKLYTHSEGICYRLQLDVYPCHTFDILI